MVRNIFFGIDSKEASEKGVYSGSWSEGECKPTKVTKIWKRLILTEDRREGESPREIRCINGEVYSATKNCLFKINPKTLETEKKPFKDLFPIENKDYAGNVIGNTAAHIGIVPFYKGLFVSLSALVKNPNNENEPEQKGYLFHSSDNSLDQLRLIPNVTPTSTPVYSNHNNINELLIPCSDHLEFLKLNAKGMPGESLRYPNGNLEGKILSLSEKEGLIVCTDDHEGYLIIDTKPKITRSRYFHKEETSDFFLDNNHEEYLPTEATSSLVTTLKEKRYVLMGLDDGMLNIYEVSNENSPLKLTLVNLIQFTSDQKAVEEESYKDNHIYGLKENPEGFIQFTLRNLYFCINHDKILQKKQTISLKQEQGENYLNELKTIYGPDQLFQLPHRIPCWDSLKREDAE